MENAKKLILVEPRVLEQLQVHNEYKELQKPADLKTKSGLSVALKEMLDEDLGDDIKAKLYQQELSRFLNLKTKLSPSSKPKINRLTSPKAPEPAPAHRPSPRRHRPRRPAVPYKRAPHRWVPY